VVAATAVAASACSRSSPSAESAKKQTAVTSTSETTTSTEKPPLAANVEAGYRAFWDAYLAAADPMNPQDPRLVAHATGNELETVQKAFLARKSAGEVIRGTIDSAPRVVSINAEGTSATLRDCYADHAGIYDAVSGARKDQESGVRHLIQVELTQTAGNWKVSSLSIEGDGCTPGS
jgi:hypothetical protein